MDFDKWHYKQLAGDADNCPHEKWERCAWEAAINACAEALENEAVRLSKMADACFDLSGRLEIKAEQETILRAAIILRSNCNVTGAELAERPR